MKALKHLRVAVVFTAAAAVFGVTTGFTTEPAPKSECAPFCYKHPITGQLICTAPCP
ncbi:hypothetical protein OWM54_21735 [Myxococcus sp. MISCRS1]|jgi:hypothetical protein|uniref:hypothetical protein n=1 Tax=Myxococcus TaxID=32 RepID=UPI0018914567|nr:MULTISPECIES: hypothetical protein [Myxococcus]MBZ4411526.1 hypothetical protein [Myxococcus sp. XM-1-1-1]MCK8499923.1 hypothetical protein [Myxococcus fulvus]MCY0999762.1 hypothetical protein [Myxococcus sp. MISCRS1]BDT30449.1 hypothetical protein MFMH1_01180 [Myxococcus sp. MH1]